jgi:carboxymethylenebutenolidase
MGVLVLSGSVAVSAPVLAVEDLPAGADGAHDRLNNSPRHGEWVKVDVGGGDVVHAWLVYPERDDKAPVVVVIHEIYGLTDWVRAVADQLAAEGFIAIAPDLLSGKGPEGGGSESVDNDGARRLIRGLSDQEVVDRLNGVAFYAIELPSASDDFAVIGFCWGGRTSFAYATMQQNLSAAVVYYGTAPAAEALAEVQAPVLGLYGGEDNRVNATIEPTATEMKRLGKQYEFEIFEGAGHGFLRTQDRQEGANLKASEKAWPRTVSFLKEHLEF